MTIGIKAGMALEGSFRVQKTNRHGDILFDTEFSNLVHDVGWSNFKAKMAATSDENAVVQPKYLYLGSGTSEPLPSDGGLEQISATLPGKYRAVTDVNNRSEFSGGVAWVELNQTFNYAEGEAEGVWTEVGLAYGSTYDEPYNRALIRDESGAPISITVLSDEFLTIYSTVRLYFVQTPAASSTITYNGVDHTVTWTISNNILNGSFGNYNVWLSGLPDRFAIVGTKTVLNHITDLQWSANEAKVVDPGDARTIGGGALQTYNGSWPYDETTVTISIDPPINVPADHQITVQGPHTVTWDRVPVPTV